PLAVGLLRNEAARAEAGELSRQDGFLGVHVLHMERFATMKVPLDPLVSGRLKEKGHVDVIGQSWITLLPPCFVVRPKLLEALRPVKRNAPEADRFRTISWSMNEPFRIFDVGQFFFEAATSRV